MNPVRLQSGPVTLYAQLANILRDRIVSGVWKYGEEIPTLGQLVEEFSVARVTVRQAVQMLVEEQFLSSQRGRRTSVTFRHASGGDANPLYSSTGSIDSDAGDYQIEIISREEFVGLPPAFTGPGMPEEKYMRIRKVDSRDGIPYAMSDNFVALAIYRRFAANAERKIKLSRLVRDNARPVLTKGYENITVALLNYEEATCLQTSTGSPTAKVTRVFLNKANKVAYFGQFHYRGDRFGVTRDISDLLVGAG
jgi:Transcriptional regulators